MVPFIDVGIDWIDAPTCIPVSEMKDSGVQSKNDNEMTVDSPEQIERSPQALQAFLEQTPWWVSRNSRNIAWDGQSAYFERFFQQEGDQSPSRKPSRRIRSLKKKDLYAAWNGMMRTPRLVRRKLRRTSSRSSAIDSEGSASASHLHSSGEESIGETLVWRRFMDQLSDIGYRADCKRLGDDRLHDLFGEFRHYIVEKYAYNMAKRFTASEPTDVRQNDSFCSRVQILQTRVWNLCIFFSLLSSVAFLSVHGADI